MEGDAREPKAYGRLPREPKGKANTVFLIVFAAMCCALAISGKVFTVFV
jgi:hypothetical protein